MVRPTVCRVKSEIWVIHSLCLEFAVQIQTVYNYLITNFHHTKSKGIVNISYLVILPINKLSAHKDFTLHIWNVEFLRFNFTTFVRVYTNVSMTMVQFNNTYDCSLNQINHLLKLAPWEGKQNVGSLN